MTSEELLAVRAESLYEELGGDLCICQRADVSHWCEKCQQRIAYILTVFRRLRSEATPVPAVPLGDLRPYVQHKDECAAVKWQGNGWRAPFETGEPCTCGLQAALDQR